MFAVPGWSLSAPLKTQTESHIPIAKTTNRDDVAQTNSRPSKKRKRKHGKDKGEEVTGENLGSMWKEVIEGKQSVKRGKEHKVEKLDKLKSGVKELVMAENDEKANGIQKNKHPSQDPSEPKQKKKRQKKDKHKHSDTTPTLPSEPVREPAPPTSNSKSALNPHSKSQPRSESNPTPTTNLTPLQASMRAKLAAARFRHLNETLYTSPSTSALKLFSENPEMYDDYHAGFRQQVAVWPENPVDSYIREVKARAAVKNKNSKELNQKDAEDGDGARSPGSPKPLPRTHGLCTIADLGCGEARLAKELAAGVKKMGLKILNFDLRASSEFVQVADIADLPLVDGGVDVVIFCLALMGTNWTDFVDEAWRVLRWRGELWVSEIKSRFGRKSTGRVVEHSVGNRKRKLTGGKDDGNARQENMEDILDAEVDGVEGERDETDVSAFIAVLRKRGFVLDGEEREAIDLRNKMFVKMRFVKNIQPVKGKNAKVSEDSGANMRAKKFKGKWLEDFDDDGIDESKVLKPCVYKLR
jgi:ribosomal RNA-processing protein 8